jgi:hypothetical protein
MRLKWGKYEAGLSIIFLLKPDGTRMPQWMLFSGVTLQKRGCFKQPLL